MTGTPEFLDGNAAAGELAQLFGTDMTQVSEPCLACGKQVVIPEAPRAAAANRPRERTAVLRCSPKRGPGARAGRSGRSMSPPGQRVALSVADQGGSTGRFVQVLPG